MNSNREKAMRIIGPKMRWYLIIIFFTCLFGICSGESGTKLHLDFVFVIFHVMFDLVQRGSSEFRR